MELVNSTDDFTVALVKMAMACLDATNFVGLANEVAHIHAGGALTPNIRSKRADDDYDRDEDAFTVRLGPTGVAWDSDSHMPRRHNARLRNRTPASAPLHSSEPTQLHSSGLAREIKRVVPQHAARPGQAAGPGIGGFWMDSMHQSQVNRLWRTIRSFWVGMWIWVSRRFGRAQSIAIESTVDDVTCMLWLQFGFKCGD